MITIWDAPVAATVDELLYEIRSELAKKGKFLLSDINIAPNGFMITCPFHGEGRERTPSCGIAGYDHRDSQGRIIKAGTVHCFRCNYRSDFPSFVSACNGYDDAGLFGFRWIMRNFVSYEIESRKRITLPTRYEVAEVEPIKYVDEEELDSYRYTHPYMYERKLTDPVIDFFDVGYDKSMNALTFPVCDEHGRVLFIQRRSVRGKAFFNATGVRKSAAVYGLSHARQFADRIDRLFITESIIDALTCWVYKQPAVALMGSSATAGQLDLLLKFPVREYILALDNDEAGLRGAKRLAQRLHSKKFTYQLIFPEGKKDINELTADEFQKLAKKFS